MPFLGWPSGFLQLLCLCQLLASGGNAIKEASYFDKNAAPDSLSVENCEALVGRAKTPTASVAAYKRILERLKGRGVNDDHYMAELVEQIDPILDESGLTSGEWKKLFTECLVEDTEGAEELIMLVMFKRGMESSIVACLDKRLLEGGDFIDARDKDGNNVYHLAANARSVNLLQVLANQLEQASIPLLMAKNTRNQTPRDSIKRLPAPQVAEALKRIWQHYHNAQNPDMIDNSPTTETEERGVSQRAGPSSARHNQPQLSSNIGRPSSPHPINQQYPSGVMPKPNLNFPHFRHANVYPQQQPYRYHPSQQPHHYTLPTVQAHHYGYHAPPPSQQYGPFHPSPPFYQYRQR